MRGLNNMKAAMARTFYDKEAELLKRQTAKAFDGSNRTTYVTVGKIVGNIQTSVSRRLIENYGLDEDTELTITIAPLSPAEIGDRLKYAGKVYVVQSIKPRDSHVLIAATSVKV